METSKDKPSLSLIKKICYPLETRFESATRHSTENEDKARKTFKLYMEVNHQNFQIEQCGLFVSDSYSECGASPEGLCSCDCCGEYLLEIK